MKINTIPHESFSPKSQTYSRSHSTQLTRSVTHLKGASQNRGLHPIKGRTLSTFKKMCLVGCALMSPSQSSFVPIPLQQRGAFLPKVPADPHILRHRGPMPSRAFSRDSSRSMFRFLFDFFNKEPRHPNSDSLSNKLANKKTPFSEDWKAISEDKFYQEALIYSEGGSMVLLQSQIDAILEAASLDEGPHSNENQLTDDSFAPNTSDAMHGALKKVIDLTQCTSGRIETPLALLLVPTHNNPKALLSQLNDQFGGQLAGQNFQ